MVRVLDDATLSPIVTANGPEAWLDIDLPGMLLRFKLTKQELKDMIEVCQGCLAKIGEIESGKYPLEDEVCSCVYDSQGERDGNCSSTPQVVENKPSHS